MTDPPTISLTSASTQTSSYISTSPPKRKRRPAGTPDPDAEVVALSPKTLLESDRYVCEICNQGFQRDQNLQMHRRRHKVPWKLLKRVDPEMRKRVYVCPEPSCLHHNPCHALGDLVGIKKHYRRKHSSTKQWECDKCSKAYAVQSDYKAHLKTCGTRGHCCDCGRVFSRVESFIEHQDTCAAAKSKRGIASLHDHQKASVAATADADHSSVPNPIPSDKAAKVMKDSSYQHSAAMLLASSQDQGVHALPPHVQSACVPAVAINTHTCIIIPASAPPSPATSPAFLLPSTASQPLQSLKASAAAPAHPAASGCASICTWETLQACTPPGDSTVLQNNKAELQLLPTKHHLNQLESSQSSVTSWGKDIISTNSNTSAICSSPALHDKLACRGWPEVPEKSGAAISPCKLQLSIGQCHQDDQSTCCGNNIPLQNMSRPAAHQQSNSETFDPKPTDMQTWLQWSVLSPAHQKNDAACHDEAAKRPPSLFTSHHEKQGMIMPITDAYQDGIHLELATTSSEHLCIPRPSSYSADHHNLTCSRIAAAQAASGFTDKGSSKLDQSSQDTHDREMLKMLQVQYCKPSLATMEAPRLLRCSSSCGSIALPEAADDHQQEEPSNSTSGSIKEPDPLSFLLEALKPAAATASAQAAAEVLLQKATEKLRRASAEKLEAEKAWREARREREKAEEEAARAERISEYNKMIIEKAAKNESDQQKVEATRRASHSSTSSSPSSVANYSQASSSSLQMQELQHIVGGAGGHVVCTASAIPSFITCPTCHHTQILYPSPNQMATLFLTSQVHQPTTLASTSPVPHN